MPVHIMKADKRKMYTYLLKEGVCCCHKDTTMEHPEAELPNLKVLEILRSMKSKGYVTLVFNWRHLYYTLTPAGLTFIRTALGLGEQKIVPKTHAAKNRATTSELKEVPQRTGGPRGFGGQGTRGKAREF
eukprot:TRINITY_DN5522_c0_g1_i1.p2 TRINITY_DN5522_c0_g1~~TRINITY_DN5522_c0_g1_i1.p2  ORF type:complete len:130 (-),score=16.73 TRINITY_DN5522_c0_g1_i1:8-397(-)